MQLRKGTKLTVLARCAYTALHIVSEEELLDSLDGRWAWTATNAFAINRGYDRCDGTENGQEDGVELHFVGLALAGFSEQRLK